MGHRLIMIPRRRTRHALPGPAMIIKTGLTCSRIVGAVRQPLASIHQVGMRGQKERGND